MDSDLTYQTALRDPRSRARARTLASEGALEGTAALDRLPAQLAQGWQVATAQMVADWRSGWERAGAYLNGLLGGRGANPLAPGQNGPFEGAYRVADVAEHWQHPGADTRRWEQMYFPGMAPAAAGAEALKETQAAATFGNWAPLVARGAVDQGALSAYLRQEQAGQLWMAGAGAGMGAGQGALAGIYPPSALPGGVLPATGAASASAAAAAGAGGLGGPTLDPAALVESLQAQMGDAGLLKGVEGITKPLADAINKDWVKQMGSQPWYKTLKAAIEADVMQQLSKKT